MLSVLAVLMTAAAVALAGLAGYAARRRGSATGASLALLLLSVAWWGMAYAIELSSEDLSTRLRWGDVKYVGVSVLPPAWLVFVLQYTGRARWVNARTLALLAAEPLALLVALAVPATHDLVRFFPPEAAGQELPIVATGPLFWVHFVLANVMLLTATVLFVASMVGLARTYRLMAAVLVGAALLPWVANFLHNFEVGWFARVDLTPFAFTVTGGVLVWGVFREHLVRISPLARSAVVDNLPDGVLVLDAFGRVVDINRTGCRIFGRSRSELVGVVAADLLTPANVSVGESMPGETRSDELVIRCATPGDGAEAPTTFHVRREPLADRGGRPAGELVVMRDITDRVRVEQRLRELLAERSRVAAALQTSLVPDVLPVVPGLAIASRYEPAGDGQEIGGDFFDVFPLGPDRWGIVLGDVSGKGAEAAAVTALARYTLRTLARPDLSPSVTLRELNTRLVAETTVERHCTLVYAVVTPRGSKVELELSLAGHHPPLVLRSGGTVEQVGRLGTALGLVEHPDLHDSRLLLDPGDLLCMFTDGLVEARRGTDLFDPERAAAVLQKMVGRDGQEIADRLVAEARRFHGDPQLADDLAVLIAAFPATRRAAAESVDIRQVTDAGIGRE